ncbi:hypothetical protein AMTRI_Chr02g258510 [Amborella trichopoda]|uniref:Retrotransposon Copia-like N-terminal domain-containing protein n=1 Tax=Amborella trichopoda TaxID=13333 RepID=U5D7H7_AMBTC|nr:hypothetical protein AMTR_s00037p00175320 [Amborella trichopoda]
MAALNPSTLIEYLAGIETLNGSNFSDWKQKIDITLGILDLDLALCEDEPPKPNNESTTEQKAKYTKWKMSNRMSLMIMKGSIGKTIRGVIPDEYNAKSFMSNVHEQFVGPTKALANL